MFYAIKYRDYNNFLKFNFYTLYDTCEPSCTISSPIGSPSIKGMESRLSNALTLLSLIHHYEQIKRHVPHNLARYYTWLYENGHNITGDFIGAQLIALRRFPSHHNSYNLYYRSVIHYIDKNRLFPLDIYQDDI